MYHLINYLWENYPVSQREEFSNYTNTLQWCHDAMRYKFWVWNRHHHPFGIQFSRWFPISITILCSYFQVISIHLNFIHWNHNNNNHTEIRHTFHTRNPWYLALSSNFPFPILFHLLNVLVGAECNVHCSLFTLHNVSGTNVRISIFFFFTANLFRYMLSGKQWIMICLRNSPPAIRIIIRSSSVQHTMSMQRFFMILMQSLNEKGRGILRRYPSKYGYANRLNWIKGKIYWAVDVVCYVPLVECTVDCWNIILYTHIAQPTERHN